MSEAIFNQSAIVEVTRDTVAELKRQAQRAPRGRFRLCMHQRLDDQVQEMVIVCGRGTYFRPHRHPAGKSESYHVIEGAMSVFFFSDDGEVIRRIDMEEYGASQTFLYRLCARMWHLPVPRSDTLVYHEVYAGPFARTDDVEFGPFSPPEEDAAQAEAYLNRLLAMRVS